MSQEVPASTKKRRLRRIVDSEDEEESLEDQSVEEPVQDPPSEENKRKRDRKAARREPDEEVKSGPSSARRGRQGGLPEHQKEWILELSDSLSKSFNQIWEGMPQAKKNQINEKDAKVYYKNLLQRTKSLKVEPKPDEMLKIITDPLELEPFQQEALQHYLAELMPAETIDKLLAKQINPLLCQVQDFKNYESNKKLQQKITSQY